MSTTCNTFEIIVPIFVIQIKNTHVQSRSRGLSIWLPPPYVPARSSEHIMHSNILELSVNRQTLDSKVGQEKKGSLIPHMIKH